jgi:hypothetical protein
VLQIRMGSGIQCFLTPESGIQERKNMDPGSYLRELIIIISFSVADTDPGSGAYLRWIRNPQ